MPRDQVDAMKAARPARQTYDPRVKPILTLLEAVCRRTDLSYFSVQKPGFQIVLTR
jgi:hypothetical protein